MKTFVYMGRNDANIGRASFKMWKIDRKDRKVTVWFGAATVKGHKAVPVGTLSSKTWKFRTENEAIEDVRRRIREKENGGYEHIPKRKSSRAA